MQVEKRAQDAALAAILVYPSDAALRHAGFIRTGGEQRGGSRAAPPRLDGAARSDTT